MRKYEGVFIVDPVLDEAGQKKKSEAIQDSIKKLQGGIDGVEEWGKRKLAYKINKKNEGIYYLVRFHAEPEAISKLYKSCQLDESLMRVMFVNTGE